VSGLTRTIELTSPESYDDIVKILSVYRKSTKTFYHQSEIPSDAQKHFKLSSGVGTPLLIFEPGGEITDGEEFVIRIQYRRTMKAGDWKSIEDGLTQPDTVDFVLSWLTKVESGTDRGKKGYLIAVAKNCVRTGNLSLGGKVQDVSSEKLVFSVNVVEEGDIEFHEGWLS
jgi:hypothetical protein